MAEKNLNSDSGKGELKIEKKYLVRESEAEANPDWDKLVFELEKIKI